MNNLNLQKFVLISVFIAIIVVLTFTPLGYLKIGLVSITFLSIPVAVGSILTGKTGSIILGCVFGLTSFVQCFGYDAFGTTLFSLDPLAMAVVCLLPRILAGFGAYLIFNALSKKKNKLLPYVCATVGTSLINTVGFVGLMLLFFGKSDYIVNNLGSFWAIVKALVLINGLSEAAVCCIIGTALGKSLKTVIEKVRR